MANEKVTEKYVSSSGSHFKQDIKYKFDVKSNCMVPYYGEKYDQYERIQLAKTQVDLDMIIKRAKAGDTSVLNVKQANYVDISKLPDNLNDLNDLYLSIDSNFNSLPKEIKNLFGDDVEVFSKAVSNGSYQDTINNYVSSFKKSIEDKKEVKVDVKEGDK